MSPVALVAIILVVVVAVTVILAAVMYVMVSGYNTGGGSNTPLAGSLTFLSSNSDVGNGEANMQLTISSPMSLQLGAAHVTILNAGGYDVTDDFTVTWVHIATNSYDDYVRSGDRLNIEHDVPGTDIDGYSVILTVDDYTGTVECYL